MLVANTKSLDLYHGKHENCYAAGERFYAHLNVKSDKCARLALTNTCASHKLFLYRKPFSVKTICRWELIIALFSSLCFSFTLFLEFSFICSSFLCLIFSSPVVSFSFTSPRLLFPLSLLKIAYSLNQLEKKRLITLL